LNKPLLKESITTVDENDNINGQNDDDIIQNEVKEEQSETEGCV